MIVCSFFLTQAESGLLNCNVSSLVSNNKSVFAFCLLPAGPTVATCRSGFAAVGLRWDRRTPYRFMDRLRTGIENESVPINDTIYLFFKTAIIILVISSHDSFRVLFDKIASAYFICKVYLYFSIGKANHLGQPREPALCQ